MRPPASLPYKRPGRPYTIVFRTAASSVAGGPWSGKGGDANPPAPPRLAFGDTCVCCNQPTPGVAERVEATGPRLQTELYEVPVCIDCTEHAISVVGTESALLGLVLAGIAAAGYGFASHLHSVGIAGVAMAAMGLLWLVRRLALPGRGSRAGHHAGFSMAVSGRQVAVRTTNRQLAEELVFRHADMVHKVR